MSDRSPLRQALDASIAETGASMADLTVLSTPVDPFRLDTPANNRLAKWLADTIATLGLTRRIHNRGLHYAILGQPKPDGSTYVSDDDSWSLLEKASKYARWLGYVDFEQITDERNAEPVVRIREPLDPEAYFTIPLNVKLPRADEIVPKLGVIDFEGVQPYRLVLVGEKSSLEPVLGPVADEYDADLYLPTGCISNTHVYRIARSAAEDGRPLVVLYFADCDPAGHNMHIEVGRKLQAFTITHFPDLNFQVHRAALTVEQVQTLGLPSSPLKAEEKRADKWRAAFGVEQTEIDALATLQPEVLRQIAEDAIAPFYDSTLDRRVAQAEREWIDEATSIVNSQIDRERLGRIRAEAQAKLAEMRTQIDELSEQLRIDVDDFDLPEIVIPDAITQGLTPVPLIDSSWSFVEQTEALKRSKSYGGGS
jgi:hypothetical protein